MYYIIQCTKDKTLFWSNEDGWVDWASATKFTARDIKVLNLPIDGVWFELTRG